VLASTVLLETLSGIAAEIKIGENGFGYIVDKNGLLFAHHNEELRMSLNFLDSAPLGYEGLVEVGLAMIKGQTGVLTYTRPNGDRLVTAFNPIPATPGWSLGVSLYQEELLGTATALMNQLIITIVAVILVVLINEK
jgi:methyl-accepting chemotaxis protein